jgi:hypothetical protein
MTYILLLILLTPSGTTPVTTTQVNFETYELCNQYSGELRALFHKANVKAITTCIKSK